MDQKDSLLFLAVGQLNEALDFLHDIDDQLFLCRLNRNTGQRALVGSLLYQAASYLRNAVIVRDADLWKYHYYLALDICSLSAEYENYAGHFNLSDRMVEYVLENEKSRDDKFRVQNAQIETLQLQGRPKEAIGFGLSLLQEFGEHFNRIPRKFDIAKEVASVSWAVRRKTDEQIISMQPLRDSRVLATMKFSAYCSQFCLSRKKMSCLPLCAFPP